MSLLGTLRNRILDKTAGERGWAYAQTSGLGDYQGGIPSIHSVCSDYVGNFNGQNPLYLRHQSNCRWWVSGLQPGLWDMDNFCVTAPFLGFDPPGNPIPDNNEALTRGLVRTNPNRTRVNLPVFWSELRDIPRALKGWGRALTSRPSFSGGRNLTRIPRAAASRYLEWEFFLKPFISDMEALLDWTAEVDKRLKTIDRLDSVSGQTFGVDTYEDIVRSGPWSDYASPAYGEGRGVSSYTETTRRQWVTTQWKPAAPLPVDKASRRKLAERLVFGLDISLHTLWEGFPWTWLTDWFVNFGDFVELGRNTIPVTHGGSCVMLETRVSRVDCVPQLNGGETLSLVVPPWYSIQKERAVLGDASPIPEFNIPFLNGRQWSILGSLAVVKNGL